ncbi:hypothetical protein THASP1DRAFT_20566 [Thamnocephalis sphaerospora]|uniref:TatD family n=1 Tax=Thamnocephalis sphaerospora TaxID=78915 RepID=A0A4P9XGV4_9FUNG|nr:hypothetical protein THASP1DRAFT_20566 [Thamnocephalis sphaerospora]|eukprot:RKP04876.1 hypothetical protein THASP1DRAFT_20566 [Thamnocephalis sphaerospora]
MVDSSLPLSSSAASSPGEESEDTSAWFPYLYDTHCHIVDDAPEHYARVSELRTSRLCLMSAKPEDWSLVALLARAHPSKVRPAFGVHPWYADQVHTATTTVSGDDDAKPAAGEMTGGTDEPPQPLWWIQTLRMQLQAFPDAVVGEIGNRLDRAAKDPKTGQIYDAAQQMRAFTAQWSLAAELGRPVSIHCVRRHGAFVDHLLECARMPDHRWPPSVVMHAYTGSADTAHRLLALERTLARRSPALQPVPRFYFSLSSAIHGGRGSARTTAWVSAVPEDRLLLETDIHRVQDIDAYMVDACRMAAQLNGSGVPAAVIAQRTWQNALAALAEP